MTIEPHDLAHEFPEYRDAIENLKSSDHHFVKMFDEYHALDREVHLIEQGVEAVSDVYAEVLKKKRMVLKDALYHMLQTA
jgi:uncharacterized protein YdcH (DUF465 family)